MKAAHRVVVAGFLSSGLLAGSCVSGDTVTGSGGRTGNSGFGGANGNGSQGGFTGGSSQGGFTGGTSQGGFTGGSGQGGFTGGTGFGGSVGGGSLGGGTGTAFMPICAPSGPLVSDMEDGNFYYGTGCPKGAWHLTTGGGGTTIPIAGDVIPVAVTDRTPSTKAIHISGSGQANVPPSSYAFVSLSASLNSPSATQMGALNAAGLTGVKFWGKIQGPIEFHVPNVNTSPAGGLCSTTSGLPTSCYDDGKVTLTPSAIWMQYVIPFSTLVGSTPPFGKPPGTPFPAGQIYSLEWHVTIPATGPVAAWDIWVDDVMFY